MGACSNFITVKSTDREKVKEAFNEKREADIWEYGHDAYSGTFGTFSGLAFTGKTFATEGEAREYILDHSEKWENALAVTVASEKEGNYTLVGGWCAE